jgi:DNA ligase (NAD+)
MKASVDQLLAIPSIGEIVATGVHTYFHPPSKDAQQRVTNMINRLSGAGLNLNYSKYNPNAAAKAYKKSGSASQSETTEGDAKLPLSGHAFVFTGKMLTLTRGDASDAVEALGGEVKSAVVKGVTYLITGDMSGESTKKLDAAQAKGITILDEAAFKKLVGR